MTHHDASQMFTAGLLHDIGKILLDWKFPHYFMQILQLMQDENLDAKDAEDRILFIDHAGIGALLLEKWNFPQILIDVVRNHHCDKEFEHQETQIVRSSNIISKLNPDIDENNIECILENLDIGNIILADVIKSVILSLSELHTDVSEPWSSIHNR